MGEFVVGFKMYSGLELNGSSTAMENPSMGYLMCYPGENCSSHDHQAELLMAFVGNLSSLLPVERPKPTPAPLSHVMPSAGVLQQSYEEKKATAASGLGSANNEGASMSAKVKIKKKEGPRRGKRARSSSKLGVEIKPKEVVHVRARRGQATDSHSLAERVRREKINETMKRLRGLVPGCHKAMGMAATLDEIIKYVQSLQNQVEFLSKRVAAISSFCDSSSSSSSSSSFLEDDMMEELAAATQQERRAYYYCLGQELKDVVFACTPPSTFVACHACTYQLNSLN